MLRDFRKITLYDGVTPVAITSSTDATPIVVTATSHGFSTGDRVLIYGHTTNTTANGIFKVTKLTANTFSLQDEFTGADVAGAGGGAGGNTGLCIKAPPVINVKDYRNLILQFTTSGTATLNLKIAGSLGKPDNSANAISARKDIPNFGATVSSSNTYTFLQVINLDTAAAINGATGVAVTGTDVALMLEINVNAMSYLTVFPATWTQGAITAVLLETSNL